MSFVYKEVDQLNGHAKVGNGDCVAPVRTFALLPQTARWKPGAEVLGNRALARGTAIATFVNGRYPNKPHGNHAALFLVHAAGGFWVMDQWKGERKKTISPRFIPVLRSAPDRDGSWPRASDDARAYSVIELR